MSYQKKPILEEAKAAVGGIRSDNLNEIRSLKMPPEAIHDVLSAVRCSGTSDTSWSAMKRFPDSVVLRKKFWIMTRTIWLPLCGSK